MRRIVAQAVLTCRHPLPGPVHLNARACKPLEPGPATTVEERDAAAWAQQAARDAIRTPVPEVRASDSTCDELADMIRATERGVIVCGPAPLSQRRDRQAVFALARRSRLPLLAEATSQLRFAPDRNTDTLDAFDTVLHTAWGRSRFSPDLIVQLGAAPTSGAWARWPKPQHTRRVVIAPFGWQDPQNDVSLMVSAPIGPTVAEVAKRLAPPDGPTMWQEQVAGWDAAVWSAADALVAPHLPHTLDETLCVRELVRALPSGALLGVGNSLPVRMLDTWCQGSTSDIAVWSQRGANGIDGVVSGMSGAARAWGGPAALLVGDVSFVHDIGGLAAARDLAHPLVVVVVNNGGGRIFEQLPIADLDQARGCFELWTTPPDVSLAHVSASYGLRHVRAEDGEGLRGALASALSRPGCTIVEAVVPASDAFQRNKALWDAVASRCAP